MRNDSSYELYYWPDIQGRGEFVRLALEEGGAKYIDVARRAESSGMGVPALLRVMNATDAVNPSFAPPFIKVGEQVIGQTANILLFLGPLLALVPKDETQRLWVHQLQLTVADLVAEVHDVHHPISVNLYYKDQKPEAKRRADDFKDTRIPKFFDYFEKILRNNPQGTQFMVGEALTYVDLSLFQVMEGLRYAFPKAMKKIEPGYPLLCALHQRIARRPRIARYLKSARRIAFTKDGIFRHYKELDG